MTESAENDSRSETEKLFYPPLTNFFWTVIGTALGLGISYLIEAAGVEKAYIIYSLTIIAVTIAIFISVKVILNFKGIMLNRWDSVDRRFDTVNRNLGNLRLFEMNRVVVISEDDSVDPVDIEDSAFATCVEQIKKARDRILVISPYFPKNNFRDNSADTRSHSRYLEEGMFEALKNHADRREADTLQYTRIIQLHPDDIEEIDQSYGAGANLPKRLIRDDGLADHVEKLLEFSKKHSSKVRVEILVRPFSASLPSILITDYNHAFLSLPRNSTDKRDKFDLVVEIEEHDTSGDTVRSFAGLFNSYTQGTIKISKIIN